MQITTISHWTASNAIARHYEAMLAALGRPGFGTIVREAIHCAAARAQRVYLFEAATRDDSDLHYSYCEPNVRALFPLYSKLYLPLDPVREAYRAASRDSDVVLQRVRPDDIASPGFRRQFFDEPGIVERLSVVQRGSDGWRAMSVARHRSDGRFSDREVEGLVGLAFLVLPMLPINRSRPERPGGFSIAALEERFASAFPELTARERQVCARAAMGMTVEATGLDLSIAKSSVLTYRKRAYRRLRISGPFELSALVGH